MSEIISFPKLSSNINSINWFGAAVPLNFINSPGLNIISVGLIKIILSVSIVQFCKLWFLPSETVMLYFPNAASYGILITVSNFQLPVPSTLAVLLLITICSGFLISVTTAVPGVPVPATSNESPLWTILSIGLIEIL